MLAMLSVLILQTPYAILTVPPRAPPPPLQRPLINVLPSSIRSPRTGALDYFTIAQGLNQQPPSPALGRLPSPVAPTLAPALAPSLSSSTSSRGSWTSIFNTGRQFVQDTFHPTLTPPTDQSSQSDRHSVGSSSDKLKVPDSPGTPGAAQGHRKRKDSYLAMMSNSNATSRSWTETAPHQLRTSVSGGSGPTIGVSFSSAGGQSDKGGAKRPYNLRWTNSNQSGVSGVSGVSEKQFVMFEAPDEEEK